MDEKKKEQLVLALAIGLLPPLWAVSAPHLGIKTGAVALICAGLYSTNGNRVEDGVKITAGFWLGNLWAVLSLIIMEVVNWNETLELFVTLAVLGALAVVIASIFEHFVFLPSWLCGWAIGLSLMSFKDIQAEKTLPIQIGIAMAVGVWYVGCGVDYFTKILLRRKLKRGN
jgi:hypothetical protein